MSLPLTCVEGWSVGATWTGLRLRDLLRQAGARPGAQVRVESLEQGGLYRSSQLEPSHAWSPSSLLVTSVDGQRLDLDHGYPLRLLAYCLRGIATDVRGRTHPVCWATVLVVAALAHDLVLVPVVFAVAVPLQRLLPVGGRSYAATGLALSGVALILPWPGLHGDGRLPDNPSVLPLDHGHGLRTTLTVLWLVLLLVSLVRASRTAVSRTASGLTSRPTPPAGGTASRPADRA